MSRKVGKSRIFEAMHTFKNGRYETPHTFTTSITTTLFNCYYPYTINRRLNDVFDALISL